MMKFITTQFGVYFVTVRILLSIAKQYLVRACNYIPVNEMKFLQE